MIFETHAHYDAKAYQEDREEVISSLFSGKIGNIVNVAADMEGCKNSILLAKKYPNMYASVGVHPSECENMTDDDIELLRNYCKEDKVVAIGEIGLDYYYEDPNREIQKKWFIKQLELANEINMPVIIHSRDAANDTYNILKEYGNNLKNVVIHCFSYEKEMATRFLDMGYYLGVGGVITFKNGRKLREVVECMPLEKIVLETDAPYLAPEPFRGKRNHSGNLEYVAKAIAEIKNVSVEEVVRATENNAKELYGLVGK